MSEAIKENSFVLPAPRVVHIDGRKFVKFGISPVKVAEMSAKSDSYTHEPVMTMKDGLEYVYNRHGKLVRLEHIDPELMDEMYLTRSDNLSEEQMKQLSNAASRPVVFDEDCPESTPEQLERFRRFGQERNRRRAEMERAKRE